MILACFWINDHKNANLLLFFKKINNILRLVSLTITLIQNTITQREWQFLTIQIDEKVLKFFIMVKLK